MESHEKNAARIYSDRSRFCAPQKSKAKQKTEKKEHRERETTKSILAFRAWSCRPSTTNHSDCYVFVLRSLSFLFFRTFAFLCTATLMRSVSPLLPLARSLPVTLHRFLSYSRSLALRNKTQLTP